MGLHNPHPPIYAQLNLNAVNLILIVITKIMNFQSDKYSSSFKKGFLPSITDILLGLHGFHMWLNELLSFKHENVHQRHKDFIMKALV